MFFSNGEDDAKESGQVKYGDMRYNSALQDLLSSIPITARFTITIHSRLRCSRVPGSYVIYSVR